jgi:hypothetical protein
MEKKLIYDPSLFQSTNNARHWSGRIKRVHEIDPNVRALQTRKEFCMLISTYNKVERS